MLLLSALSPRGSAQINASALASLKSLGPCCDAQVLHTTFEITRKSNEQYVISELMPCKQVYSFGCREIHHVLLLVAHVWGQDGQA